MFIVSHILKMVDVYWINKAFRQQYFNQINILLDGFDINKLNSVGDTLFFKCMANKDWTPLHAAVHNKFYEGVRILLEYGAYPKIRNTDLKTALNMSFRLEDIKILIQNDANIDISIQMRGRFSFHKNFSCKISLY